MTKSQQLTPDQASPLIRSRHIEDLSGRNLIDMVGGEKEQQHYAPENYGQIDPRSEMRVLFSPARAIRPNADSKSKKTGACPICQGNTTPIIDLTDLSRGFTFVNQNLYPAIFPHPESGHPPNGTGFPAWGMHFLQWTSSFHDQDWYNMEVEDLAVVMHRLGALERHLLSVFRGLAPDPSNGNGHVSIFKNGGLGSGGSLEHGHQQVAFSNFLPQRAVQNQKFERRHGSVFSEFILQENPASLLIKDFGAARLLVPYFMRRPYDMLLVVSDTTRQYLHELTPRELRAVTEGWKTAITAIHRVMNRANQLISYNVITHNGPGAGLYFEFLPRTQTEGGFELLGSSVCQSLPELAASQIRQALGL